MKVFAATKSLVFKLKKRKFYETYLSGHSPPLRLFYRELQ